MMRVLEETNIFLANLKNKSDIDYEQFNKVYNQYMVDNHFTIRYNLSQQEIKIISSLGLVINNIESFNKLSQVVIEEKDNENYNFLNYIIKNNLVNIEEYADNNTELMSIMFGIDSAKNNEANKLQLNQIIGYSIAGLSSEDIKAYNSLKNPMEEDFSNFLVSRILEQDKLVVDSGYPNVSLFINEKTNTMVIGGFNSKKKISDDKKLLNSITSLKEVSSIESKDMNIIGYTILNKKIVVDLIKDENQNKKSLEKVETVGMKARKIRKQKESTNLSVDDSIVKAWGKTSLLKYIDRVAEHMSTIIKDKEWDSIVGNFRLAVRQKNLYKQSTDYNDFNEKFNLNKVEKYAFSTFIKNAFFTLEDNKNINDESYIRYSTNLKKFVMKDLVEVYPKVADIKTPFAMKKR